MKVKVGQRVYLMPKKKFKGLLEIASEQIPFGIYAVSKNDYAEMLRMKARSITELKKNVRELKKQGYKVYCNGL